MSTADGGFAPTHKVRERGTEAWVEVRADGVEPQTYYDREGKTIYAGIWFQNMEVRRLTPAQRVGVTDEMVEKAAEAILNSLLGIGWVELTGNSANDYREAARAALSAALGGDDR